MRQESACQEYGEVRQSRQARGHVCVAQGAEGGAFWQSAQRVPGAVAELVDEGMVTDG
jgi:hypothetical protein